MIPIRKLVNIAQVALDEKWGYIWGKSGQVWTQANQDAATRDMTVRYGQKWVGKRVADCSGLFVYAFRECGGKIYHGSNTIWNDYLVPETRGPLAGVVKIRYGAAVFQNVNGKRTHIGWYRGGGMVEEERGTQTGCILSPLATWDEYGELKDADYTGEVYETFDIQPLDTITKGAKGELVKYLQNALIEEGYDVGKSGADGVFGTGTLSAVRAFQYDNGLTSDGKVGQKTWAKIKALVVDDEPDEEKPTAPPVEPQEPNEGNVAHRPLTIEQRIMQLELAVFGMEFGGDPDV